MTKLSLGKDAIPAKDLSSKDASLLPKSTIIGDEAPPAPPKIPTKIKLQSFEGKVFDLEYNVAKLSQTIKSMVEDSENPVKEETPIKLNNISSEVLSKIIDYIKHYSKLPPLETDDLAKEKRKKCEIKDFDLAFVQNLDRNLLFELIMASNFLYIRGLIDLLSKHAANSIRGKSIKEVREQFNIKNDFTPAEEEQLKEENRFCEVESIPKSKSGTSLRPIPSSRSTTTSSSSSSGPTVSAISSSPSTTSRRSSRASF